MVLTAIGASALALAFAHLPPVFKKIGLFAIAYGVLVGLMSAWLVQSAAFVCARLWLCTVVVALLAVGGEIGIAAESYRMARAEEQRLERAKPDQLLARRLLESAEEPTDAKSRSAFDEFRSTHTDPTDSFGTYLAFRVSNLGIRSKGAAAWFWAVEVALGGAAAVWLFSRQVKRPRSGVRPAAAAFDATSGAAKLDE